MEHFGSGKLSLAEVLDPAISLAEEGFPVHENTSRQWQDAEGFLKVTHTGFHL